MTADLPNPSGRRSRAVRPTLRPEAEHGYLPALDGLRAVAVLIVMLSHIVSERVPGGFGVTLFFFISGFIITRNLSARPLAGGDVWPFYVRRFCRLAPAVFVYIAAAAAVIALLGDLLPLQDALATVLYYANYHHFSNQIGHFAVAPLEMTWSLAVEEHFYLCFPLALLWARRPDRLAALLMAVVVAAGLWRWWLYRHGAPGWSLYTHTDTRLDSIAYGCLLSTCLTIAPVRPAVASFLRRLGSGRMASLGVAVLAATLIGGSPGLKMVLWYSIQGVALVPIFCYLFFRDAPPGLAHRVLASRFMTWTGRLSYSLYLYHVLANYATKEIGLHAFARVAAAFLLAYAAAWLSLRCVETPGRRLGKRLASRLRGSSYSIEPSR